MMELLLSSSGSSSLRFIAAIPLDAVVSPLFAELSLLDDSGQGLLVCCPRLSTRPEKPGCRFEPVLAARAAAAMALAEPEDPGREVGRTVSGTEHTSSSSELLSTTGSLRGGGFGFARGSSKDMKLLLRLSIKDASLCLLEGFQ